MQVLTDKAEIVDKVIPFIRSHQWFEIQADYGNRIGNKVKCLETLFGNEDFTFGIDFFNALNTYVFSNEHGYWNTEKVVVNDEVVTVYHGGVVETIVCHKDSSRRDNTVSKDIVFANGTLCIKELVDEDLSQYNKETKECVYVIDLYRIKGRDRAFIREFIAKNYGLHKRAGAMTTPTTVYYRCKENAEVEVGLWDIWGKRPI